MAAPVKKNRALDGNVAGQRQVASVSELNL